MHLRNIIFPVAITISVFNFVSAQNTFPASGNVGIGTPSPSNLLQVHHPTIPANTVGAVTEITNFSNATSTGNTGFFKFLSRRHTLGTADWSAIGSRLQFITDVTNQGYLEFNPQGDAYGIAFGSSSGEIMRLKVNGNVGIGTTSPGNKLHVNGNATIGENAFDPISYGSLQIVRTADQGDNRHYLSFVREGNSITGMGYARNSNVFGIWKYGDNNATAPVLAFTDAQNVGIGTSAPGPYKLAVEGTMAARKIKVTQATPWADYVFDEGYRLWTLEEVEKFIREHKHLPELPSAKEVEKEGLDLGDNQALLLKKIEELTLYVIEQNKKIEQQDKKIGELEKKLKKISM